MRTHDQELEKSSVSTTSFISRYTRFKHRNSGALVPNEARMSASSAETQKSETRNALKDQRRNQETT